MNKFFKWLTGDVLGVISKTIDDVVTSDEERLQLRNELQRIISEKGLEADKMAADIIQTEAKGNWLQKSWRPILMLSFGFIVMYSKFFAPAFGLPNTVLEPDFWELLRLGIGGYVVGRSAEKITEKISNNFKFKK